MLDNVIIEELKRIEREKDEAMRLPLELPLYREPDQREEASPPPEDADRGVVIIQMW